MSAKHTKRRSSRPEQPRRGQADLTALRRLSEREIAATSPEELADLPADFWTDAELVLPGPKEAISLRVDQDVLEWFRAQGPRYQSRINAVLRTYVRHVRARGKRRPRAGAA